MMKQAIISIKSFQGIEGEEEKIELTTEGKYALNGEEALLTYDESSILGVKKVKTYLHCRKPDAVILKRTGEIEARLVIEKGKSHLCKYALSVGELMLDITGEEISMDLDENGGEIKIFYRIDAAKKTLSKNRIEITVRTREDE